MPVVYEWDPATGEQIATELPEGLFDAAPQKPPETAVAPPVQVQTPPPPPQQIGRPPPPPQLQQPAFYQRPPPFGVPPTLAPSPFCAPGHRPLPNVPTFPPAPSGPCACQPLFPMGPPAGVPMPLDSCGGPPPMPRDGFFGNLAMTKSPGALPPAPRLSLLPLLGETVSMELQETSKHGKQFDNFVMFLTLTMQAVRRALLPGQSMRVQDIPSNVERHVGTTFEKSRLGLQDLKDLVSLLGLFPDVFEVDASGSGGPVVTCRVGGSSQVFAPDERVALMLWQRSKDLQPRLDCLATYRAAREAAQRSSTQPEKDEEGAPPWRATAAARGKSSSTARPPEENAQGQKRPAEENVLPEPAAKRPPTAPQGTPDTTTDMCSQAVAAKPPPAKAPWQPPAKPSGPPPPPPPPAVQQQPPAKASGPIGEPSLAALLAAVEEVAARPQGSTPMTPAKAPITKQPPTQEQWMRMRQPSDLQQPSPPQQAYQHLPAVPSQGASAPPQIGQPGESLEQLRAQERQLNEQLKALEQHQQMLSQQQMQLMQLDREQDGLTPSMQSQLQQHTVELWNQQKLLSDQKEELRLAQQRLAESFAKHLGAAVAPAGQQPNVQLQMPPPSMAGACACQQILHQHTQPAPAIPPLPNLMQQLPVAAPPTQQPGLVAPPPPPAAATLPQVVLPQGQQQGQDGQLSLSQLLQGQIPVGQAQRQPLQPTLPTSAQDADLTAALLSALPGVGLGSSCAQVAPPTQQLQQQLPLQSPQAPSMLTPQMIQVQHMYQAALQR